MSLDEIKSRDGSLIKYVNSPNYASTYCNNIGYSTSAVDFVLIFGEIIDIEPNHATVERRARITMTPVQAKVLRGILDAQITNYEQKTGKPIELPPGVTDDFSEIVPA